MNTDTYPYNTFHMVVLCHLLAFTHKFRCILGGILFLVHYPDSHHVIVLKVATRAQCNLAAIFIFRRRFHQVGLIDHVYSSAGGGVSRIPSVHT